MFACGFQPIFKNTYCFVVKTKRKKSLKINIFNMMHSFDCFIGMCSLFKARMLQLAFAKSCGLDCVSFFFIMLFIEVHDGTGKIKRKKNVFEPAV
jgi:hypothetical protein